MNPSSYPKLLCVSISGSLAHLLLVATLSCLILHASSSQSIAVTFSSAPLAADGSNTLTDGSVFVSVAYGGDGLADGDRVINGQSWDAFNTLPPGRHVNPTFNFIDNRNAGSTFYGAAGTGIKNVTDDIVFASSLTLGLRELVPGNDYRIQAISYDAGVFGFPSPDRPTRISSDQDAETLSYTQTTGNSQSEFQGVLVTGLFTADATGDIDFTFEVIDGNDNAILNAFIVHDLSLALPTLTINRDTGEISLANNSGSDIDILGYRVKSNAGALDPSVWSSVAGRLDAPPGGDGSIDSNDTWTVETDTAEMFSVDFTEGALETDGATIADGTTVSFGAGSWVQSPVEDVLIELLLNDGNDTIQTIVADFVGNGGDAFQFGDFDFASPGGNAISASDWAVFRSQSDGEIGVEGTTEVERYRSGDLNGDGVKDIFDVDIFIETFDAQNGMGAFSSMIAGVPEPSSLALALGAVLGYSLSRRSNRGLSTLNLLLLLLSISSLWACEARAQTLAHHWRFDNNFLDSSGNNNDGTAINDTPGFVAGRFGQAVSITAGSDFTFGNGVEVIGATGLPLLATDSWTMNIWANLNDSPGVEEHLAGFGINEDYQGAVDNGKARAFITLGPAGAGDVENSDGFHYWAANVDFNSGDKYEIDGNWHMYTIAYDQPVDTINMYKDGLLVASGSPTGSATLVDAIPNIQVGNPSLWNEGFNGQLDEFSIWSGAFTPAQVDDLFYDNQLNDLGAARLSLEVNRETGEVTLLNTHPSDGVSFNSYQVSSDAGAIRAAEWNDLAGNPGFSGASSEGAGDGWEPDASSNENRLIESFFLGDGTLASGSQVSLGNVFTPGGPEDLNFIYRDSFGTLIDLDNIDYVGEFIGFDSADFDRDNDVDSNDLAILLNAFGTTDAGDTNEDGETTGADFLNWQRQATATQSLAVGITAIPEPSSIILLSTVLLLSVPTCSRRL